MAFKRSFEEVLALVFQAGSPFLVGVTMNVLFGPRTCAAVEDHPDAIVVGAGAAGLMAARRLAERGYRVEVVEARDRVGGRAWSESILGGVAELGAEFIHGTAPDTHALLREAGLRAEPTGETGWTFADGKLQEQERDFFDFAAIFERARTLPGDESVERFLQRFSHDPAIRDAVERARSFVEGFDAADPTIAGVFGIERELASGIDDSSARPHEGYGALFGHLQRVCSQYGVRFRFSTIVQGIAWSTDGVRVIGMTGNDAYVASAPVAVVTLPAAVLRARGEGAVAFEPALPLATAGALGFVETGSVVKVSMAFRNPFWHSMGRGRYRDAAFFRTDAGPFPAYWTRPAPSDRVVAAWAGGPAAAPLARIHSQELVERALDGFGKLLGDVAAARAAFMQGSVHDWDADPFARGAYSYLAVGGADARAQLAKPIGASLFFAGEATSADGQSGTVNGALQTGKRAAAQAAAALGAKS